MGKLIASVVFFLLGICLNAQDTAFHISLKKSIPGNYTDFNVDEAGNIYLVINESQLKKIDRNGDSIAVFNNVRKYGKIHSVDVTNPLKILLYYKTISTIVVLDRFLSIRQVIDLRKSNIQQAKAVRLSYDNNIWLFDELESKIKKLDENGKLLFQSADLRNVFTEAPSFQSIFDNDGSLYLYDLKQGWFVFDYYGAFRKKYAFLNWQDEQVINNQLIGRVDNLTVAAKAGDFDYSTKSFSVPLKLAIKVQNSSKHTYILFHDRLEIYDAP
jgi:hypothetical protein